jgi:hypothetical protein
MSRPDDLTALMLDKLADELAERLASKVAELLPAAGKRSSPWLTTTEAIEYTRLAEGTFRKLCASGKIPSHGGRAKLFYRPELDQSLLDLEGVAEEQQQLRRVS